MSTHDDHSSAHQETQQKNRSVSMYIRFGAMILTAVVIMYFVMFAGSWEWSHIRLSESRIFMALTMGGTMVLIMLGWMLNMYKNTKAALRNQGCSEGLKPPASSRLLAV